MRDEGRLGVAVGVASEQGPRPDNQDFAAAWLGTATERARHGAIAALADGVSGARGGRQAAELAVRGLIDGFYAQPDTIGVAAAVERVVRPYNRWLAAMGRGEAMAGAATTLTAIVLRGRRAHVLHVGDSRAWRLRGGRLHLITTDHCHAHPDRRHVLLRALGLEDQVRLDHHAIDLAEHDRLVLTSDGIHGVLGARRIEAILARRRAAEADSRALVEAALHAGGQDNATALVLDVIELPAIRHDAVAGDLAGLPILPVPEVGDNVDGFVLDGVLSDGRQSRLFRARGSQGEVVIKFPKPALIADAVARAAFAREAMIASRVSSPFVGTVITPGEGRRSRLYGVQPFYPGPTLAARLATRVPLDEALAIAVRLTRAVAALHRLDIVHRDIKPENVILTGEDGLRLVDLGVARLPRLDEPGDDAIPGTPGYLAPEMYRGEAGNAATDQFALGVCLWRLFARTWPYGEIEAFSRPRFRPVTPPSRACDQIPGWLDAALMRAVAIDPADRFGDVIELLRALEGGAAVARVPLRRPPLIERHPVAFWQGVSALLFAGLIAALVWR
jgi:serine/threonine protein phosphatase PrpC